jgi:hypothetical protein
MQVTTEERPFVVVWSVGMALTGLAYVVCIWPAFRKYSRTSGVGFEIVHFGIRGLMVSGMWPVFAPLIVYSWFSSPPNTEAGATHDSASGDS